jgi:hypothetical protein
VTAGCTRAAATHYFLSGADLIIPAVSGRVDVRYPFTACPRIVLSIDLSPCTSSSEGQQSCAERPSSISAAVLRIAAGPALEGRGPLNLHPLPTTKINSLLISGLRREPRHGLLVLWSSVVQFEGVACAAECTNDRI